MVVHRPNPNTERQRQRDLSEFQVSQGYTKRPCLKGGRTPTVDLWLPPCIGMYTHVQSHKIQTPEHRRICIPLQINPAYVYPSK